MNMPSLTSRLLAHPQQTPGAYERATQSAFLRLAGRGRLPRAALSQWLAQDRLYAQAYARFVGGLLSRVRLPAAPGTSATTTVEWRVVQVLRASLDGILAELAFFEDTAGRYGLDLAAAPAGGVAEGRGGEAGFGPSPTTAAYVDLFDSFGAEAGREKTVLDGLVLLWVTEKVYHDAWTYAREQGVGKDGEGEEDLDGGALRKEFIPNWTSDDFAAFVAEIEACLNEYAEARGGANVDDAALKLWAEVLRLEEGFWPEV